VSSTTTTTNGTTGPNGNTAEKRWTKVELEALGLTAFMVTEAARRLGIEPQYHRLVSPGKDKPALHATFSTVEVGQIREEIQRARQAESARRAEQARRVFSKGVGGGPRKRSNTKAILASLYRIEAHLGTLPKVLEEIAPAAQTAPPPAAPMVANPSYGWRKE
jgi:hypothetical protein